MKNNNRAIRRAPLAAALALVIASPAVFAAGPQGGVFRLPGDLTHGTIDQTDPNATKVNLTTGGTANTGVAVIDWGNFNVDAGSSVGFDNSTGMAQAVINVDTQGSATQINGAINTSGDQTSVLVVNPNGVSVGSGAQINTSGAFLAAAGSVDAIAGQVSINLSQAPLVVDESAQINAGYGAGPGDLDFGVAQVTLRSDGSPATLPVSWVGKDTQHNIFVDSPDGTSNFQLNDGWRTEGGNPQFWQEGRSRYSLTGAGDSFITTNGGSLDGVGIHTDGNVTLDATGTVLRDFNLEGSGSVDIFADGMDNVYATPLIDADIQVDVSGTIANSYIGNNVDNASHAGVYIKADRIENSKFTAGRGGSSAGSAPLEIQAREIININLLAKNGGIRLFDFDLADGVAGRADFDRDGNRQSLVLQGNDGSTLRKIYIDKALAGVSDTNVVMNGYSFEDIYAQTDTQINIQQGGFVEGMEVGGVHMAITSPGDVQINNLYVNHAPSFSANLGAGSSVSNGTIYAANLNLNGGAWNYYQIDQTDPSGVAQLNIEGMNGGALTWMAPMSLNSSGALVDVMFNGSNDFTITAPLISGNSSISSGPLNLEDPDAGVSAQLYLGRLEGSVIGVTGDLYLEVDTIGEFNGMKGSATTYRGDLVARLRSADGSILSSRGGFLDVEVQENLDNSSIFLTGSKGGTVIADSVNNSHISYDQPRVDDPEFEPVPAPIGNGELTVNARRITGGEVVAYDSNLTVNASEAISGVVLNSSFLQGTADQTRLTINSPMIDMVLANSYNSSWDVFGSLFINADTVQDSTLRGTNVEVNAGDMLFTTVSAINGNMDVRTSRDISGSSFNTINSNADIRADQINNSQGQFDSSSVSIEAGDISGLSVGGSAGNLSIKANDASHVDIYATGTNLDIVADSASYISGSELGNTRLDIGSGKAIEIFGASSIEAIGGDWSSSALISYGDMSLDINSLSGSQLVSTDGNISGNVGQINASTIEAMNINLTVAEIGDGSVLNAIKALELSGGTMVIQDSKLLADVLRIQSSGDLSVDGESTLDAVARASMEAAGKLGIGETGGNVLITSESINGKADRIVIGDNAALVVRTPNTTTGSNRIQVNGEATYTGDADQQASGGNFFGSGWTIVGDGVVLLNSPEIGVASGEAGITLTANTVEVNGGTLFAGPGQEAPVDPVDPPVDPVDPPVDPIQPPQVRVQTVLAGDVSSARYTNAVLLVPANTEDRQGGVE